MGFYGFNTQGSFGSKGWLMFFLASMGVTQAHEQAVMNYWWVRPEEAPAHAARVIRVLGEKGERFEDVYTLDRQARLENSPVVMQARLQRQEMLRREAMALVKKLKAEGKSPLVAYEEAWTRVYKNRWLTANWQLGSSKLEDMLLRMSGENQNELTAEEQQWVLEALLENDDRLETETGRELLRRLTQRLRALGYGKLYAPYAANDQVMKRFADALSTGMDSMAAYREAMFTTHRDRVGQHTLHGYVAPWGLHVGGPRYHQAPLKVSTTEGSASGLDAALAANPQPGNQLTAPGLNGLSAAEKDFLAVSPEDEKKEKDEEDEKKNEQEDVLVKQGESAASAPASGMAASPAPMMRSFSLRAAAPYAAGDDVAAIAENTITAGTNTSFHTTTTVSNQTLTLGNWYAAKWNLDAQNRVENGNVAATITFDAWDGGANGVKINGTPASFNLAGGNLYLGNGYSGTITVSGTGSVLHAEALEHDSKSESVGFLWWQTTATAHAVYQVPGSGEFNYGTLSGSGELTLSNNAAANNAVIYIFNDASASGWFDGTIKFGASRGGIVELDLGARTGSSTAWSKTEFNMSGIGTATDGYGIKTSDAPSRTILNIRGNVSIAGLSGGANSGTVTSESGDKFYDLTLGDDEGQDYVYSGTFNGSYYTTATQTNGNNTPSALDLIKVGGNQQTITTNVSNNASRLHSVSVQGGTLRFDADGYYYDSTYSQSLETAFVTVSGGELLVSNLTVTGVQEGAAEFLVTGGSVKANGDINVTYDMGVMGGGTVSASNVSAGNNLGVSGSRSSLIVSGSLETLAMRVEKGGLLRTKDIIVEKNLEIGTESSQVDDITDEQRATLISSGNLTAGELRLRGDGFLQTGASAITLTGAHMHGGAKWKMAGEHNTLNGQLYLENVGGNDGKVTFSGSAVDGVEHAVLTLPGMISLAGADWGTDGKNALFHLDNVLLDFRLGVTLTNAGIPLKENSVLTLASTSNGGGYVTDSLTWVRVESAGALYHGELGTDADNNVIITIQHKLDMPYVMASGNLLYIEMYQDAHDPALPYKAHDTYSNGSWSGDPAGIELIRFSNLQISEGADLYLGEKKSSGEGAVSVTPQADRHFGGNITVTTTSAAGDAAQLHGEIGDWGNWYLDGHLGGSGELKLVAHNSIGSRNLNPSSVKESDTTTSKTYQYGTASTFTFTDYATPEAWFSGTLRLANPHGGIVQLNIGNVNIADAGDIRWKNTVIDLTLQTMTDKASGKGGKATEQVLGLVGDAQVAGVDGGAGSFIVSNVKNGSNRPSPVLTLGSDGKDCEFGGTVGDGRFYSGGQASGKTSTTTTTTSTNNSGGTITTTTTSTVETNCLTMATGALSLTKVGSNTQIFSGKVYLDQVLVKEGELQMIGSETNITSMAVFDGAKVTTGSNVSLGTMSLYGGSTWYTNNQNPNSYSVTLNLVDVYGESGTKAINIGAPKASSWIPAMYVNMAAAGAWQQDASAIFNLQTDTTLDLNSLRVYTNLSGISGGEKIALFQLSDSTQYTFKDNVVMVEDKNGHFYDAGYVQDGKIIYLQLKDEVRHYGIVVNSQPVHKDLVGYIWSGEDTGHTIDDVHHINLTMGNVWRADGSAENTGWHEQRAAGSSNDDIGKYVDGNTVYFLDTDVHGKDENHRMVEIVGQVAPGHIIFDADKNAGFRDPASRDVQFHMEYAYALVSHDGSGCIADYVDAEGNVTPTSITMQGEGLVVLNLTNTFSGGIDVQNGGLYVATVGAAGTGALKFHTDQEWSFDVQGQTPTNTGIVDVVDDTMFRTGAELMICYQHSDDAVSGFRGSTLRNDIILYSTKTTAEDDFAGRFKVSFAYAAFNETDQGDKNISNIPRHWRNLTLSGALVGAGYESKDNVGNTIWVNTSANDILELTGYCSTWANERDQSYTTSITLNEDTVGENSYIYDAESGKALNRFQGKVVMKNTVNTSPLPSNQLNERTAGTVQVVLKGEKLSQAHMDMTRESVKMGRDEKNNPTAYEDDAYRDLPRQTYNNILMLNGDATLKGLSANFQGCGWDYPENNSSNNANRINDRKFIASMPQHDEVWHVRTLTNGLNTLSLGEVGDKTNTSTYIYSGAMGFAQAYVGTSQAHVPWGDGFLKHTDDWYFGGHSMAQESLSLIKASASSQYIHTAVLDDVSVYEGTLGFNNLNLKGNLNLVGGSVTKLGVTTEVGWNSISANAKSVMQSGYKVVATSDDVTLNTGKTLTVFTPNTGADTEPTAAVVDGNVIFSTDTALTFLPNGMVPDSSYDENAATGVRPVNPLLDVNGTLQFLDASPKNLAINLTGVNFSKVKINDREHTYFYLAEADNIVIGDKGDSSSFQSRIMSLGYGYFGVLDTLDSTGGTYASPDKNDYLVIRVYGDPRCTWSGKNSVLRTQSGVTSKGYSYSAMEDSVNPGNIWRDVNAEKGDKDAFDYRWKENQYFENGMTVLFGNLYEPVAWTETSELTSVETPIVKLDDLQDGHPADSVTVDGHTISWSAAATKDKQAAYRYENVVIQGRVAPLSVVINSDYFDVAGNVHKDATNYIFTAGEDGGYIDDAEAGELDVWKSDYGVENLDWKTNLTKLGKGTTIMTTDNRFTGGTEILGGRIVMQHVNALGAVYNTVDDEKPLFTGNDCTITLMNGGELMGDFNDEAFPGNHEENITTSMGAAMDTTTIRNKVVVNVYANPDDPDYNTLVDGRIFNNTEHKLVLTKLEGESDTVVEFAGVGYTAEQAGEANKFRYGVFKVLDPSGFSGTVTLTGKHWELSTDGKTADLVNGGNVQLNLMSHTKSEGKDWTKATVDLSIKDGTDRTVLGLDATGQATAKPGYECVYLNSIHGQVKSGSSSVLNMSAHNELTLILTGTRSGAYEGVMGYGDFEVSVDYGGYAGLHGTTQHHYGAIGFGSLNLIKQGEGSTQSARRAWLNAVTVEGGTFKVDEALVARTLTTGGGKRVMVGDVDTSTLYALAVGKGGTLAMNTTFNVSGSKTDAWAGVSAGTTVGDSTTPAGWVLLEDGATLSAREDWYTRKQVDMAPGAHVTINTHNFIIDPYLTEQHNDKVKNEVVNKYEYSHIIQLLGQFSGRNVHLTFNNLLTNADEKDAYLYPTEDSPYMGYVALNDLNDLTGSSTVNIGSMTVLQIMQANGGEKSDVDITVAGKNATLQLLDMVTSYNDSNIKSTSDSMVQYIDKIVFGANVDTDVTKDPLTRENNGQLLLGGSEKTSLEEKNNRINTPDLANRQVLISSRHNSTSLEGEITNLNIDLRKSAVKIGGDAAQRSEMSNVHIDMAHKDVNHNIYQANLRNSMIHLMEDCSVSLENAVLIDYNSVVRGVKLNYTLPEGETISQVVGGTVNPFEQEPNVAAGYQTENRTTEVRTSVNTTVQLTFADEYEVYSSNGSKILVLQTEQFLGVDVDGSGLTIQLYEDPFALADKLQANYVAFMMGGKSGQFFYEEELQNFDALLDSQFVLRNKDGEQMTGYWISSVTVAQEISQDGMPRAQVSMHMLYFRVPEPATATLSLAALVVLMGRRRRKD